MSKEIITNNSIRVAGGVYLLTPAFAKSLAYCPTTIRYAHKGLQILLILYFEQLSIIINVNFTINTHLLLIIPYL